MSLFICVLAFCNVDGLLCCVLFACSLVYLVLVICFMRIVGCLVEFHFVGRI